GLAGAVAGGALSAWDRVTEQDREGIVCRVGPTRLMSATGGALLCGGRRFRVGVRGTRMDFDTKRREVVGLGTVSQTQPTILSA
ncbi:unnamed protein product, partial [Musa textilis]